MAFRIPKEEYINRTFRLRKELVDQMEAICNEKNISLNKLTVLCIEYALANLEDDSPEASAPESAGAAHSSAIVWGDPCQPAAPEKKPDPKESFGWAPLTKSSSHNGGAV